MSFRIGSKHKAICTDGVVRTAVITNHPDTFFSVPARVKAFGKTVTGFVTRDEFTEQVEFIANSFGKNGYVITRLPTRLVKRLVQTET